MSRHLFAQPAAYHYLHAQGSFGCTGAMKDEWEGIGWELIATLRSGVLDLVPSSGEVVDCYLMNTPTLTLQGS